MVRIAWMCLIVGCSIAQADTVRRVDGVAPPSGGNKAADAAAAVEPFDYFANSWSVIGLKDYQFGTRITPENELLLDAGQKVQIRYGRELTRLSRAQVKTNLDGWLPIILLHAEDGPILYEFTMWATPLPSVPDLQAAFSWPKYGENFLNWITVKLTNTGQTKADGHVLVLMPGKREKYACWLEPGQSAKTAWRIPFQPRTDDAADSFGKHDPAVWRERTAQFWRKLVLGGARIAVPDEKATQALLAAHVCQLIANDRGVVHGGEGFYDEFYIRDGAYQVMELEEAGLTDVARVAVEEYLTHQLPDGRFETQKNQFDANGQAVWTLWQFYRITGDRDWLSRVYPQMRKAVDWTIKARRQATADSPFTGLLPATVADGEYLWDGKHHIVGYDLWNLRGLLCTLDAASTLHRQDEAVELSKEADAYRAAIDAAWKRAGVPHFPPSWEKKGTHWGNTETLWPTELFALDDPRVAASAEEIRERHGGGFIEGTMRWTGLPDVNHPYVSAYTTMNDLIRGRDEQVVQDFYWYLLHSSATHAFPEGIFFKRRFAWSDTIPHVTGACNYAIMLRHMLVHERAAELHLLWAVPDWWLGDGKEIVVERAPTHFGPLGLRITGEASGVRVKFDPPLQRPSKRVVLHLPKSRPPLDPIPGVEVILRADQTTRWDFARVLEQYSRTAPALPQRIPGVLDLPVEPSLAAGQVKMLDLTSLANTDSLAAPFGVQNPGKFVFKGLPLGTQTAAGVPFQVIDPAANGGRSLIVLHSAATPAGRALPKQATIPVNAVGKRLFFLGNVSGWGFDDAGAGEWGAVAEYVIQYVDGQSQTVPLVTNRTIEEWTAAPTAADVVCGLKGEPWHLNVLGVKLRPVTVEKIIFRDLGTPAAPVLAAVTLEP